MLACAALVARSASGRTAGAPRGRAGRCGADPCRIQPGVSYRKRDGPGVGRIAVRHHGGRNGRFEPLDRHHVPGLARLLQLETAAAGVAGRACVQGVRSGAGVSASARDAGRVGDRRAPRVVGRPGIRPGGGRGRRSRAGHLLRVPLRPRGPLRQLRRALHPAGDADGRDALGVARPPVAPGVAGCDRGLRVPGEGHGHPDALGHHRRK
jgi:hypothetical protein